MENQVNIDLDISQPQKQTISVSISWLPSSQSQIISLPRWTPGSYTLREHCQHLHSIKLIQSDKELNIVNKAIGSWEFHLEQLSQLTISYIIEAKEDTVRTSYVCPEYASLCLSSIVMRINDKHTLEHQVKIRMPDNWQAYFSSSDSLPLNANNYDELVDTPIIAGNLNLEKFEVKGYKHKLLLIGESPIGINNNFLKDVKTICEQACNLVKEDPASRDNYIFFLFIKEKLYGGLEHNDSSVIQYSWRMLTKDNGYRKLLQLIGHEYFHQWNIRRLRPTELLSYDYSSEMISENLWFAEGITSYFDLSLPYIAGISTEENLYEDLTSDINLIYQNKGRLVDSLSNSSRETWIKLYKKKTYSNNFQISYYTYGTILSLCLDIKLRSYNSSLSKLFRNIWRDSNKGVSGYSRESIKKTLGSISTELEVTLDNWLDKPNSLPLRELLELIGIGLYTNDNNTDRCGMKIEDYNGTFVVTNVIPDSSAQKGGIIIKDEIIAINGYRVRHIVDIETFLYERKKTSIHYVRDGILKKLMITNTIKNKNEYYLKLIPGATEAQNELRSNWLQFV